MLFGLVWGQVYFFIYLANPDAFHGVPPIESFQPEVLENVLLDLLFQRLETIDHPVIASRDLDATRAQFERLGFTVPPRGSHIEWGTGNLCIMFPDDYLEVRGIIDPERFTMHLDTHLEEHDEGLMGVAFGTSDVKCSFEAAQRHGINTGELRQLRRNWYCSAGWSSAARPRSRCSSSSER